MGKGENRVVRKRRKMYLFVKVKKNVYSTEKEEKEQLLRCNGIQY
jgi:hypothetical protein